MALVKSIVNDIMDSIEDIAATVIGIVLAVFVIGAWYGSIYAGTPKLWYPLYVFIVLLVLKLVKDVMVRTLKSKE
ncbi:hypothetical protein ACFLQ2_04235 [archaeon]